MFVHQPVLIVLDFDVERMIYSTNIWMYFCMYCMYSRLQTTLKPSCPQWPYKWGLIAYTSVDIVTMISQRVINEFSNIGGAIGFYVTVWGNQHRWYHQQSDIKCGIQRIRGWKIKTGLADLKWKGTAIGYVFVDQAAFLERAFETPVKFRGTTNVKQHLLFCILKCLRDYSVGTIPAFLQLSRDHKPAFVYTGRSVVSLENSVAWTIEKQCL